MQRIHISEPTFLGREREYVQDAMSQRALSMGTYVRRFEDLVAMEASARYAVAVTSGTTALHAALLALGTRPGDRVVVPACSYVATANAVRYCGADPVFVDVRPDTWTLDPVAAEVAARAHGAVGIITVNLYGVPCTVPNVPGVWVLEDACESHGTKLGGDAAVFSYYGNKIMTCGEGGAIVTDSPELADKCRLLRGQGTTGRKRYVHEELGFNYRMTDLQAAIGVGQMETLGQHLHQRAMLRLAYSIHLPTSIEQQSRDGSASDWVASIKLDDRDHVAKMLEARGVETRPVFPALHQQPQYLTGQNLPVSEELAARGLLLPLHLGMNYGDVVAVCAELRGILEEAA